MGTNPLVNKIFGIGVSRTGTTSLGIALLYLGIRTAHYVYTPDPYRAAQALLDSPIFIDYRQLDRQFPNSRFIYTDRDPEAWVRSFRDVLLDGPMNQRQAIRNPRNRAGMMNQRVYRELFGTTDDLSDEVLHNGFCRHRAQVVEYFADRPSDLLMINVGRDDNDEIWNRLTAFLGLKVPGTFPVFANQRGILWEDLRHPCKVS